MRVWEMSLDEGSATPRGVRVQVARSPKGWQATVFDREGVFCRMEPSPSAEGAMSRANLMFSPMVQRTWKEREV